MSPTLTAPYSDDDKKRRKTIIMPSTPASDGHQGSVSSMGESIYGETDHNLAVAGDLPTPFREYGFYYTKYHRHMVICAAEQKTPLYFVEVSQFRRHKPDVTLHTISSHSAAFDTSGPSFSDDEGSSAPIVAVAYFPLPSRNVKIGIGDPANSGVAPLVWEEMKNCKRLTHSEYAFELSSNSNLHTFSNSLESTSTRRSYLWQRTHSEADGVEGSAFIRKLSLDNYKLLEGDANGKTIAVF